MEDFGIKVTGAYKSKPYRPDGLILKLNGEELSEWDLKFLYTRAEMLDYDQIAELFDTTPRLVSQYAYMYGISARWKEKEQRRIWFEEERKVEEAERERLIQKEAEKFLENVRKPRITVKNGKKYVNAAEWEDYQDSVENARMIAEMEHLEKNKRSKEPREQMSSLRNVHLIAFRAYRGLDRMAFAKKAKADYKAIKQIELSPERPISKEVERLYTSVLKMSRKEIQKIIDVLTGERDLAEESDREIPIFVKVQVWDRDKGKCTSCGRNKHLHYHHIKHFSKGGMHREYNIKLLCVACHAEAHRNDKSFHMLKKMAEEKLGVIV